MRRIIPAVTLCLLTSAVFAQTRQLEIHYLKEGTVRTESIPLGFISEGGEIVSPYIHSVKFGRIDSVEFESNHPDKMKIASTPVALDFKQPIAPYSAEYYTAYTVHGIHQAIEYYNRLFDGKIDFNSQAEAQGIEVLFGDIPLFSSPDSFIFPEKALTSPSLFYHEVGHRAFRYMQSSEGLGIKFKGLSYIHMGLLEYFTVSLNNSPMVGEDFLPGKLSRNAAWIYPYPISESLRLETTLLLIEESYPEEMKDPASTMYKYCHASRETYKEYFHVIDNHRSGMIVTSTLWRIREQLGQDVTDRLVAQTVLALNGYMENREAFYQPSENEVLPGKIEWYDLYYGLVQKDRELNNGRGHDLIRREFGKTGFPVEKVSVD